jgi:hypothetical protein
VGRTVGRHKVQLNPMSLIDFIRSSYDLGCDGPHT